MARRCQTRPFRPPGPRSDASVNASLSSPLLKRVWTRGLSAQRIYQDLVAEQDFSGSYDSVKRFVRQLEQAMPLPFRRIETEAGQEAQVDFGQGAWVVEEGRRRRPHALRVVLSHSRKGYTEVFWRQTTENFIRGLENAFRHFGGVTSTLVIDYVARHIIDVLFPPRICALSLQRFENCVSNDGIGYIMFRGFSAISSGPRLPARWLFVGLSPKKWKPVADTLATQPPSFAG